MVELIKSDLLALDTGKFYKKYLLGQDVWYFRQKGVTHLQFYDDFKHYVSDKLEIHFNNICIVGSAKTGVSFSPEKKFKGFDQHSDMTCREIG